MAPKKIKTGVDGLDKMLNGGLIEGRPYLVTGGPGAGKTILAMQFLVEGTKTMEKGLYIALEEQADELKSNMETLGWDLRNIKIMDTTQEIGTKRWALRAESIVSKPELNLTNLLVALRDKIAAYKPKRIVIDSVTSMKMLYQNECDARRDLLALVNFLTSVECTTILTAETGDDNILMEEFLASGVIKLEMIDNRGEVINGIRIEKMRGTDFDKHLRPMKITNNGIVVFPDDSVFK